MLKYIKDDAVKFIAKDSSLIPVLEKSGWTLEKAGDEAPKKEALKKEGK
jgi:hypothetical protein